MGQQQLLLVILVTILVGIATVIAISTFSTASKSLNHDGIRQDLIALATSAQAYYHKPAMLGGGGNSFDGFTFHKIGFAIDQITDDGLHVRNANGIFHIWRVDTDELGVYGEPVSEISGQVVTINTLVADDDYFSMLVTADSLVWLNTP